jgi:hypothetical protein
MVHWLTQEIFIFGFFCQEAKYIFIGLPFSCHTCPFPLLWNEFDNCLCNFCSLKFHVVCTCTFFRDTICLLTNRKMIKIVTLIDLPIVLTCNCWHCFLVFNIWVSHGLEMTIHFYLPNPWVVLFFIYLTLYSFKILFTQHFSLLCHRPP